jgi:hypothetical protein
MLKVLIAASLVILSGQAAAQSCGPTPYSIRLKELNGKITVTVPPALRNITSTSASLGADYVRRMFAATAPAVLDEVLDTYDCLMRQAVDKDKLSDEKRTALLDAWSEVKAQVYASAVKFTDAWNSSLADGAAASPLNDKQDLTPDEKALMPYIAKLPLDNFLVAGGGGLYGEAVFNGLPVNACGGFVRSALVDNEPGIQHFVAAIRPTLVAYVSSVKYGSRDAKMKLWTQARNIQLTPPASATTANALASCKAAPEAKPVVPEVAASAPK